jgi:hypothetical protein
MPRGHGRYATLQQLAQDAMKEAKSPIPFTEALLPMNLQNPDSLIFRSLRGLDRFVRDTVLPVWLSSGFDEERGMFVEELTLGGKPLLQNPRGMRVQARQIYAFSCATLAGFIDAAPVLVTAFRQMAAFCWHRGGGWIFSVDRKGAPTSTTRFCYEQAFAGGRRRAPP